MKVKIKKLVESVSIPNYAKTGDAAVDLTAISVNETENYLEYETGLAIEIPEGYFGLIRPRSSVSKMDLAFSTSGIVDSGYRGQLTCRFKKLGDNIYEIGDRIAQLVIIPYPVVEFEVVEELSASERGAGGYGSTGK